MARGAGSRRSKCRAIHKRGSMSLTTKNGQWYWKNWLGLQQSPYFDTEAEAKEWRAKFK
jgi:hypothetical protein